jgi:2-methylcitrate synthase
MDEEKVNISRGLEGVIVNTTNISKVMPEINSLVYKGYPVQELAENCGFEEVAYLLWYGELPNSLEYKTFINKERSLRNISEDLTQVIQKFPQNAHPMDTLKTAVSFLGMEDEGNDKNIQRSFNLLAKIPTIIAADYRIRNNRDIIAPREDLTMSENFFYMCFGEVPSKEIIKAFDVSLILYAEHGFNASTFTARVITSTQSDLYSAVVGAIGALKGPLHGGANEAVMHVLKEIEKPEKAKEWILKALEEKRKIMGFGHRVYRKGDSRVPTMKKYTNLLSSQLNETRWRDISQIMEDTMKEVKGIYPNLDFPAGPAYYLMGFDINLFTPIFVMSRVSGWTAHIMEQSENNRIIRPLCQYLGPQERKVTPLEQRD